MRLGPKGVALMGENNYFSVHQYIADSSEEILTKKHFTWVLFDAFMEKNIF